MVFHANSKGKDGFQTSAFTSILQLLHSNGDKTWLSFPSQAGSLKWALTLQELTVKSPHHLLLSEGAREPNLWTLASSVPTGSSKELRELSETSRAEWHKQPSSSNNQHSDKDVTCHHHPNNNRKAVLPSGLGRGDWKSPRISAAAKKTPANLKMQEWTRVAA